MRRSSSDLNRRDSLGWCGRFYMPVGDRARAGSRDRNGAPRRDFAASSRGRIGGARLRSECRATRATVRCASIFARSASCAASSSALARTTGSSSPVAVDRSSAALRCRRDDVFAAIERQAHLPAGHRRDRSRSGSARRAARRAARDSSCRRVALRERVEAVALARDAAAARARACRARAQQSRICAAAVDPPQLLVEELDVEVGVVDHELGAAHELQELLARPRRSAAASRGNRASMPCTSSAPRVDLAPGIQVAVERLLGRPPVDELDAADLDDAMPRSGSRPVVSVSSTIWRIVASVTRWAHRLAYLAAGRVKINSRCRRARASRRGRDSRARPRARSRDGPSDRAPSATRRRGAPRAPTSACQRSWFFTGLRSAVRQPRARQARTHSVMPLRTYVESVYSATRHGCLQRLQRLDRGRQLHAVVRRRELAAAELLLAAAEAQHDAPAAGPGVAAARPVRERLDLGHQRSRRSGAVGSVTTRDTGARVVGSTKLPTTRSRARRLNMRTGVIGRTRFCARRR